jgi:hypothetical protein
LGGHIPTALYDAINDCGIVEHEVEIEISRFRRGRPAQTYGPPENCYPAEPSEWDEEPAEDYGCRILSRLLAKAATCEPLRKELVRPTFAGRDLLHTIRKAVNDTIFQWDNSEEVYAEMAARQEYEAEAAAEARAEARWATND